MRNTREDERYGAGPLARAWRRVRGLSDESQRDRLNDGVGRQFTSADTDVLTAEDFRAERYAAFIRLTVSLCLMGFLGTMVALGLGRIHSWLATVCILYVLLGIAGIYVTRERIFRSWFPWMTSAGDALFLFGVAWFGPWLDVLPGGSALALVSQWSVFIVLAVEALRAQARTIVFQTLMTCGLLSILIWAPTGGPRETSVYRQLFSDSSNLTRITIVMLAGMVLALGAQRSRSSLKAAIVAARERSALQRFHPAEINNQVGAGDMEALRQGSRHRVCILFADLRGFTGLSEHLTPERVVKLLNSFRTRSEKIVRRHGGVIDKFIGDGLLAVFGLEEPRPDDASNAVAAARALVEEIGLWSDKRSREGRMPLPIGIGLHSGEVFVGIVGTDRMEFTVIGDAVNIAQRLEAMTREMHCSVMASRIILEEAGLDAGTDPNWKDFPDLNLRGRSGNLAACGGY